MVLKLIIIIIIIFIYTYMQWFLLSVNSMLPSFSIKNTSLSNYGNKFNNHTPNQVPKIAAHTCPAYISVNKHTNKKLINVNVRKVRDVKSGRRWVNVARVLGIRITEPLRWGVGEILRHPTLLQMKFSIKSLHNWSTWQNIMYACIWLFLRTLLVSIDT